MAVLSRNHREMVKTWTIEILEMASGGIRSACRDGVYFDWIYLEDLERCGPKVLRDVLGIVCDVLKLYGYKAYYSPVTQLLEISWEEPL